MKQEYEVTNGKFKGMKTTAATQEQAVKNLKQQVRYKNNKLTDVEKDVIFVAMDLLFGDYDGWIEGVPTAQAGEDIMSSIIRKLKIK